MVQEEKKLFGKFLNERSLLSEGASRELSPSKERLADCNSIRLPLNEAQTYQKSEQLSGQPYLGDDGELARVPDATISPKVLFHLIGTLNLCFGPTYDFMQARSDEFCLEPTFDIVEKYIADLCSVYVDKYKALCPRLWQLINEDINIADCEIYSYRPDNQSDPYSEGCLQSFNYFFYNKSLNRILFFSLRVLNNTLVVDNDDTEDMEDIF